MTMFVAAERIEVGAMVVLNENGHLVNVNQFQRDEQKIYEKANSLFSHIEECGCESPEVFEEYADKVDTREVTNHIGYLRDNFIQWVDAYTLFKKRQFRGVVGKYPELKIYWRVKPELKIKGDFLYFYARLFIGVYDE